ncbi:ATP-dependent helicase [Paenibacillus sp. FSL H7-0331]|uniref:ATP-dependent helicase n=1 Tax=Paenibacillus sp. FSL H7-0331 TaxID=1920421 RepID=UPI00096E1C10|nr:ATP-dependent helicase [Paenibacillus sp. FSL H7-0331]OMF06878.1 DNA helicase [Paenibacillus sp. FSL H7-0331]
MELYTKKLDQLKRDPDQLQALLSERSTVVIAGPGSGKTTVLTLKIMRLLKEKISPPRGLACVTFNKAAAEEFKDRLKQLGYQRRSNVFQGTVHSFCISEVIAPFAHLYHYGIPLPLRLISAKEKRILFNNVVKELKFEDMKLKIEDMDKERTLTIEGISKVEISSYDIALRTAKEYEIRLHSLGMVDFVDVVKYATLIIQKEEYVRNCLEAKFPWILIDEYQDLGKPLHEMVLNLFYKTKIKIFAVGDPDQSIYSYNGAIPDYLMELYETKNVLPIELTTNYRSNQDIIDASGLALGTDRIRNYKAGLRLDEKAEFHFMVCEEEMAKQYEVVFSTIIPDCVSRGVPLEEICVIVGRNSEAADLGQRLSEARIPFHIARRNDLELSDIVKWLMKCAVWTLDKTKESLNDLTSFWSKILMSHDMPANDQVALQRGLFETLTASLKHSENLGDWISFLIDRFKLMDLLTDSSVYPEETENLEKLITIASEGQFVDYTLAQFSKIGKPVNQVTVTTRHSSKGLEFEVVIMLGMEEERFPSYYSINSSDPSELEEEHRVFFVCVSRAKRVCYLLRSRYFKNQYGRKFKKEPSRFWEMLEIKYGEQITSHNM